MGKLKQLLSKEKKLEKTPKKTKQEFKVEKKISKLTGKNYIGRR